MVIFLNIVLTRETSSNGNLKVLTLLLIISGSYVLTGGSVNSTVCHVVSVFDPSSIRVSCTSYYY